MKLLAFDVALPLQIHVQIREEQIVKVHLKSRVERLECLLQGEVSDSLESCIKKFIEGYLRKETLPLPPLHFHQASPFTQNVLHFLETIPFGQHSTYSQAAQAIGRSKGFRAVGNACGRNPFPFFLPCHRILSKNGIGGFSCGLHIKKALLKFEGIPHPMPV